MSFISDILGSAKTDIIGGVTGAINQLGRGDLGAAVDSITSIVPNVANNLAPRDGTAFGDGLAGLMAREDAVQDWNWYCILPSIGGKQLAWYYVVSANTPHRKFNAETLRRNGHSVHLAESYEMSGNLSLKFFLDTSSKTHDYLKAWARAILSDADPTQARNQGIWGLPAEYKRAITIVVMSPDRKDLLTFKYLNCWPSDPQALELGAGSEAGLELTVDFQVEDVDLKVSNALGVIDNLKNTARGMAFSALSGGVNSIVQAFKSAPSATSNEVSYF